MEMRGLTTEEVEKRKAKYGKNILLQEKKLTWFHKILDVLKEPMFLLLLLTSIIYFLLGEPLDGAVMLIFITFMIGIEFIQEWKTGKTIEALKNLSTPKVTVIRDFKKELISSEELVPGDIMIVEEGQRIAADGQIVKTSDLCVDESSLTGESIHIWKELKEDEENYFKHNWCYAGTLVVQGSAFVLVKTIGSNTAYGKIGQSVASIVKEKTPLQMQINKIIKIFGTIAFFAFLLVMLFTYFNLSTLSFYDRIVKSILSGITLAMAMIPEEFPVVLTVFLSMGAWRLAKKNSLVRKLSSVETLGAISVLCVDKTGTITENKMEVVEVDTVCDQYEFLKYMFYSCEENTYDPMERAFLEYVHQNIELNLPGHLVHEYPFTNEFKMMGHVWRECQENILVVKGSPEYVLKRCHLNKKEYQETTKKIELLSSKGYRVIAFAISHPKRILKQLEKYEMDYCGIVALEDPVRKGIENDIANCYQAGIRTIMMTGDSAITAKSIALKIGIHNVDNILTGNDIDQMSDEALATKVGKISIFARMIPEHKMRIIKALKMNEEVVAMTGDGVNDAPALKYADIGIAMGKNGSEVSREAADLILLDDNFSTIVDTIADGRRIYDNIKRAIMYILIIHIPIVLASLCTPLLKIPLDASLLLPIHIVLLELIIDPTCSIVLERCEASKNIMHQLPRKKDHMLLYKKDVGRSLIQGIVIFLVTFGLYCLVLFETQQVLLARTLGLMTLIVSNLFLVLINRSDELVIHDMIHFFKDRILKICFIILLIGVVLCIYTPLRHLLKLTFLGWLEILIVLFAAFIGTMWYEIVKIKKS